MDEFPRRKVYAHISSNKFGKTKGECGIRFLWWWGKRQIWERPQQWAAQHFARIGWREWTHSPTPLRDGVHIYERERERGREGERKREREKKGGQVNEKVKGTSGSGTVKIFWEFFLCDFRERSNLRIFSLTPFGGFECRLKNIIASKMNFGPTK